MNKNSTPDNTSAMTKSLTVVSRPAPHPRNTTIERIRQFARVYTYVPVPVAGAIGGIVLN
ncbi:MAG: hypothetical protein K2I12_05775 [Duncaniella sp.]|nr:hypothetical protein [Duncaniella sp.]